MRARLRLGLVGSQLALCLVLGASVFDAFGAHEQLAATLTQQHRNDALIAKIDSQLDSLARGTQQLAQQGNPNAARIVASLSQSGIHINGAHP